MIVFIKKEIRRQPMGLSMNERRAVTKEVGKRYQKARQFCKADLLANTKGVCQEKNKKGEYWMSSQNLPDIPDVTHLMR
ncbi:MAG: hypothetical protein U9N18_06120 [Campylobacterota bacterium]|nr:hypothetical protein [Campylobacterota bacterium]